MDSNTNTTLTNYTFRVFQAELEDLHERHTHEVRRPSEVTLFDEFAKQQLLDISPELYQQKIPGWSRSFYTHEKHMNSILQYASPNIPFQSLDKSAYEHAIDAVKNELRSLPCVRAIDVKHDLDHVPYVQSSAAGYGYVGAKGPPQGANHLRAISRAHATLYSAIRLDGQGIDHALSTSVPDVGYTRTQLTDLTEKTKVRGIWGRAFHYILLEGTSAAPLLEAFKSNDTFVQIGSDPIVNVPRKLSDIANVCHWIYALDWSQFDATCSRFEITAAFHILKNYLLFPNFETEQAYEFSRLLFLHKKIAAPNGKIYWSHKGIPSGSYFTSLIGSIINRLRIEYLWYLKFKRSPTRCYTLGDDSLLGDEDLWPPQEIAKLAQPLNWLINPSKTEYSTIPGEVTFLGRTTQGLLNRRDLIRCLRLLILPEYPVDSGAISAYRAQAIADDAGGTSQHLNRIALRLRRMYGFPQESDVPLYFRRYYP